MIALALVLIAVALVVGVAGVAARFHRLPRNRVLGVRTRWTMSRVDTFRRANRAAAPAFTAGGVIGLVGGGAALVAPSTTTAVTLVVMGTFGLLLMVSTAGVIGMRYAEADEAFETAGPVPGPCTATPTSATPTPGHEAPGHDAPGAGPCGEPGTTDRDADPSPAAACVGSCSLCPRAAHPGSSATASARPTAPTTHRP